MKTTMLEVERPEFLDAPQDVVGQILQHGGLTQPQYGTILWPGEFAGQQEELVTQLGESERLPGLLQAESLEGGDQIVGEANDFQEQCCFPR